MKQSWNYRLIAHWNMHGIALCKGRIVMGRKNVMRGHRFVSYKQVRSTYFTLYSGIQLQNGTSNLCRHSLICLLCHFFIYAEEVSIIYHTRVPGMCIDTVHATCQYIV